MTPMADELTPAEHHAFLQSVDNVKRAALVHLTQHGGASYPIAFYANVQRSIDRVMQTAIDRDAGLACGFGCSHCCHARVEATVPEVFRVADAILNRPPDEVATIATRLREHLADNAEKIGWGERLPCPFLSNSLCTIYDIRPAVCRKAHSLDLNACRTEADVLPQDLSAVVAVEALTRGTAEAYCHIGLDGGHYEFVSALQIALTDRTAKARWLDGQPSLSDAQAAGDGS